MFAVLGFLLIFSVPIAVAAPHGSGSHRRRDAALVNAVNAVNSANSNDLGVSIEDGSAVVARAVRPRARTRTRNRTSSTKAAAATSTKAIAPQVTPQAPAQFVNSGSSSGLWQPKVGASWQILLSKQPKFNADGTITPNVDIYDVDLFDTPTETIDKLHKAGKKVICYFSAGSFEEWRDDAPQWSKSDLGNGLDGWKGEYWVKTNSPSVRKIMAQRIADAAIKGCDAIDPDNVDAFDNDENGLGLTPTQSADYIKFLAAEAAKYGMSTGLKNALDIIPDVIDSVQFSVNEECGDIGECEGFKAFIDAGKPVLNIEYPSGIPSVSAGDKKTMCAAASEYKFSTVLKKSNLDGWVQYCDGATFTTPTA